MLIGIGVTITYQIISNWFRKRQGRGKLPPISTTAYFGTMLLLFAIISTLFSYSGRVAQDKSQECQARININNVSVANERQNNLVYAADAIRMQLASKHVSNENIREILAAFVNKSTSVGRSIPVTTCNTNPNVPTDVKGPPATPTRSP